MLKIFDYTKDFPREYKHTLGQDMKRDSIQLVRSIYRANKAKENIFPARRQTVTVPGPINAAVTSIPGPMDLKKLNFILKNCTFD